MAEENKEAAAQEAVEVAQGDGTVKVPIPISEPSLIHRKIPRAVFFEDVEAWVEKYGDDELFG